jgi:hypothetical protein
MREFRQRLVAEPEMLSDADLRRSAGVRDIKVSAWMFAFFGANVLAYAYVRTRRNILKETPPMLDSLSDLEHQRNAILQQMLRLPDFRSGSITATRGTCGKANCRCHQPNQPGHGPNYRLTRKVKGKSVTETFATSAELRKAEREVEAYHRFRQLAQELLEINEKICRARPVEQERTPAKKKRRKSSTGKWLAK